MHILELAETTLCLPEHSVPNWMLGAFRRRSISFSDGLTDIDTRVYWLQSRNLTIDLRLPAHFKPSSHPDASDPLNFEGWYAETRWSEELLSWENGTSYQLNNRWPEPAQLKRIGNCMIEFAPSGAYVEDWRLLNHGKTIVDETTGPLIGLELVSETDLSSGLTATRRGALVLAGNYAGLVIGRVDATKEQTLFSQNSFSQNNPKTLQCRARTTTELAWLMDFETHIALKQHDGNYRIEHSLNQKAEQFETLMLDGFSVSEQAGFLNQTLERDGHLIRRLWRVDGIESKFNYQLATETQTTEVSQWRENEQATLERYTQMVD